MWAWAFKLIAFSVNGSYLARGSSTGFVLPSIQFCKSDAGMCLQISNLTGACYTVAGLFPTEVESYSVNLQY